MVTMCLQSNHKLVCFSSIYLSLLDFWYLWSCSNSGSESLDEAHAQACKWSKRISASYPVKLWCLSQTHLSQASSLWKSQRYTKLSGNDDSKAWISASQKSDMKNSGDQSGFHCCNTMQDHILDAFSRFTLHNELSYNTVSGVGSNTYKK